MTPKELVVQRGKCIWLLLLAEELPVGKQVFASHPTTSGSRAPGGPKAQKIRHSAASAFPFCPLVFIRLAGAGT
jgi:hypothetical protein